jgi:cell division septum initiation protein DivIVA
MIPKDQEIKILEETIQNLTPNSYLGPWLTEVKAELQAMMRADSFPCVSLTESAEQADRILARAERDADQIVTNAKQRAEDRERLIDDQRERARALIIGAQQSLLAIEERL